MKNCIYCQKTFKAERNEQKYCSSNCYHSSGRKRIKTKCGFCGKDIEVKEHRKKEWNVNYCNRKCYFNYKSSEEGRKENALLTSERLRNYPSSIHHKKSISGKRVDLENTFMRSSWEANYARYLNYKGIVWSYEQKTFIFNKYTKGSINYTPDFYLPESDEFIEVKGYFNSKDRTKIKRFRDNYPEEFSKLKFLIQKKQGKTFDFIKSIKKEDSIIDYILLESQYKEVINGWEIPFKDKEYFKLRYLEKYVVKKITGFIIHYTYIKNTLYDLFNLAYISEEGKVVLVNVTFENPDDHNLYEKFSEQYNEKGTKYTQWVWVDRKGWDVWEYYDGEKIKVVRCKK